MKKETLATEVTTGRLGKKATEDFKETLECQAKTENQDCPDNQVLKVTLVILERREVWARQARKAALEKWEYQVQLGQKVPKETLELRDIPESEEQMERKETLEYLVSRVSGSQDLQEKKV